MNIKLNNKEYQIEEGTSLAVFMESTGIQTQGTAIAINYEVIPKKEWEKTILEDHMELMLIHAVSGG